MNLDGKTVFFLGKLAASNRKDAEQRVRQHGGKMAKTLAEESQILVVGEGDVLPQDWNEWNKQLDETTRNAFENGSLEMIPESQFWETFDEHPSKKSETLYTPSMLAELTAVPLPLIRKLERLQFIVPKRQVFHLSYFGIDNFAVLKIVKAMLNAGLSPLTIFDRLQTVLHRIPKEYHGIRIAGKNVLYSTSAGTINQNGQNYFLFVSEAASGQKEMQERPLPLAVLDSVFHGGEERYDAAALCEAAWMLEEEGNLLGAADLYRAALAAGGSNAQINFQIAELLYRLGDFTAARERYFTAIELDEDFVEARANLGCVLVELGSEELAAAAFRGALKIHPDYGEVHYHLAKLLQRNGLQSESDEHFRTFLKLMPDSAWEL